MGYLIITVHILNVRHCKTLYSAVDFVFVVEGRLEALCRDVYHVLNSFKLFDVCSYMYISYKYYLVPYQAVKSAYVFVKVYIHTRTKNLLD